MRKTMAKAIMLSRMAEHEQLQVERRAQATPARVQQLATRQLDMRAVTPGITQYVTVNEAPAVAPVAASAGAEGSR